MVSEDALRVYLFLGDSVDSRQSVDADQCSAWDSFWGIVWTAG